MFAFQELSACVIHICMQFWRLATGYITKCSTIYICVCILGESVTF
jgi:hypothetical protein